MAHDWLLLECTHIDEPRIIGKGNRGAKFVPLAKQLSPLNVRAVMKALSQAVRTSQAVNLPAGSRNAVIFEPLVSYRAIMNGGWLWIGPIEPPPPPHDPAGAWYFDLTSELIGGSDELLDIYRQPRQERRTERTLAEAFPRLTINTDAAQAFATIVKSPLGAEHQATWTIDRDDGQQHAGRFSCRIVEETVNGEVHRVLRGITHDVGPARNVPAAPQPTVLEARVLDAVSTPGTHRALVNVRTSRVMRWMDQPPENLAWTATDQEFIHPDDAPVLAALRDGISAGRTEGKLRIRATDGEWIECRVTAWPVVLDIDATAALWEITPLSEHESDS